VILEEDQHPELGEGLCVVDIENVAVFEKALLGLRPHTVEVVDSAAYLVTSRDFVGEEIRFGEACAGHEAVHMHSLDLEFGAGCSK
jgi:hypothetical protein